MVDSLRINKCHLSLSGQEGDIVSRATIITVDRGARPLYIGVVRQRAESPQALWLLNLHSELIVKAVKKTRGPSQTSVKPSGSLLPIHAYGVLIYTWHRTFSFVCMQFIYMHGSMRTPTRTIMSFCQPFKRSLLILLSHRQRGVYPEPSFD